MKSGWTSWVRTAAAGLALATGVWAPEARAGKVGVYSQTVNGIPWPYILYETDIYSADGTSWYPIYEASIGNDTSSSSISFTYDYLEFV